MAPVPCSHPSPSRPRRPARSLHGARPVVHDLFQLAAGDDDLPGTPRAGTVTDLDLIAARLQGEPRLGRALPAAPLAAADLLARDHLVPLAQDSDLRARHAG